MDEQANPRAPQAINFLRAMYEAMAGGTAEQKQQLANAINVWIAPLIRNLDEAFVAGRAAGIAEAKAKARPPKGKKP